ncbi:MAG: hypothetical protein J7K15_07435 [Deltaproteobacteria bacterium]|nr:hypothetical protein [Deltaproteobacteria bacterium]
MVKKLFIMPICILCLLSFLTPCYANDYVSLYHYGQDRSYCSARQCAQEGLCEEGVYPCVNTGYPYKRTRSLAGFKDLYNMNDARNVCEIEYADYAECRQDEVTLYLHLSTLSIYKQPADMAAFPDGFRIFIPPGTVYAGVTIYMPIDAVEGFVVRYKQPPDAEYLSYAFGDISWDVGVKLNLDLLKQKDAYLANGGGHAYVLPAFGVSTPLAPENSGWIYIRKLPFSSGTIHDVKVTIRVNLDAYLAWYNNVSVAGSSNCVDSNQAVSGSKYCWDEAGDPWAEGAYVESVSCSSSNLEGCPNKSACEGAGGYWYGDTCNDAPACTQSDLCDTEDECVGSWFYWYDGLCHVEARCRVDNLNGCETEEDCGGIGKYWYGNTCNGAPACTQSDLCDTEDECVGSGFYWYDSACHDTPSYSENCSPSHLDACQSNIECQDAGGAWNGISCHKKTCSSNYPSACTTSAECQGAGGYWYDSSCHARQECSQQHPEGCNNFLTCKLYGGIWECNVCRRQTLSKPVCDSDHLSLCITEGNCQGAGGYWYDGGCNEEADAQCGPDHLDLCTTETACEGAGGYMSDGQCRDRIAVPSKQTSGYMETGPVDLGDGVADGEIVSGDKMRLRFDFAGYKGRVDMYAAIQIPNSGFYFIEDNETTPFVTEFHAFEAGVKGPVEVDMLDDFDACEVLGNQYNGNWWVYFLVIPAQETTFDSFEEFSSYLDEGQVPYGLGWYGFRVDCQ